MKKFPLELFDNVENEKNGDIEEDGGKAAECNEEMIADDKNN